MSGSISLNLSKNFNNNSSSVAQGIISLFLALVLLSCDFLSKINIPHSSTCLSYHAIDVTFLGADLTYSSVKASPHSV